MLWMFHIQYNTTLWAAAEWIAFCGMLEGLTNRSYKRFKNLKWVKAKVTSESLPNRLHSLVTNSQGHWSLHLSTYVNVKASSIGQFKLNQSKSPTWRSALSYQGTCIAVASNTLTFGTHGFGFNHFSPKAVPAALWDASPALQAIQNSEKKKKKRKMAKNYCNVLYKNNIRTTKLSKKGLLGASFCDDFPHSCAFSDSEMKAWWQQTGEAALVGRWQWTPTESQEESWNTGANKIAKNIT